MTGVRAQKRARLDEAFVTEFLAAVDVAKDALPELERRAAWFDTDPLAHPYAQDIHAIVRSLEVTLYNLMFLVNRVVEQRVGAKWKDLNLPRATIFELGRWPVIEGPPPNEDSAYWDRLLQIRKQTMQRALTAARGLAQIFGVSGKPTVMDRLRAVSDHLELPNNRPHSPKGYLWARLSGLTLEDVRQVTDLFEGGVDPFLIAFASADDFRTTARLGNTHSRDANVGGRWLRCRI